MHIGLFVSCLINSVRPSIGIATLRLLQSAQIQVSIPKAQACCGQPAYNSGYHKQAREFAERTIEQFKDYDYIVVPSGSCAGMLSHHYPQLLQEPNKTSPLSEKVIELSTFLCDIIQWQPTQKNTLKETITYHDSCAGLRELGIKSQPRQLLKACGIQIKEMKDSHECCGFGGTFSVKYANISTRMAENKVHNACDTKADTLVMGDLGCMLTIEGRLSRLQAEKDAPPLLKVMHIAEILAKSEGLID